MYALYLYHRRLGYGRRTSIRLALWCMDYSRPYRAEGGIR